MAQPPRSFLIFTLIASLLTALVIAGCGGGVNSEARRLASKSIVQSPRPLNSVLVSDHEVAAQPSGPARLFLEYWSTLQYGDFYDAASYYSPALVRSIGIGRLVAALAGQAAYFRSALPQAIAVKRDNDGHVSVDFLINAVNKPSIPASLSWQQVNGSWKIVYDGALDIYLSQYVELQVQQQIDPTAQTPSIQAGKAGARAKELQERYLEELGSAAITSH
jgi:hypothetical protein